MQQSEKPVVVVTIRFYDPAAERWLEEQGLQVRRSRLAYDQNDADLSREELLHLLDGASAWILGAAAADRSLLEMLPSLGIVARRGVGYDNIDTEAARELGKYVTITAGANDASVADHSVALMLGLSKRLHEGHERLCRGNWSAVQTTDLFQKTVGLFGFGRIAVQVARRLRGFDATILTTDPFVDAILASELGVEVVGVDELLERSDVVSLHAPLTPATRHVIDAGALERMKSSALLVNTSRSGLVDEAALLDALRDDQIGGAALDVFDAENTPGAIKVAQSLLALPNVLGSAHSAGSSRESLSRGNMSAAQSVVAVLRGNAPVSFNIVVDGRNGLIDTPTDDFSETV